MQFYPKNQPVKAQQFTDKNHPEWVTIVTLIVKPNGCRFIEKNGLIHSVLLGDWIVQREDGSFTVFSSDQFERRYQQTNEVDSLKESLDRIAQRSIRIENLLNEIRAKVTIQGVQRAIEEYDASSSIS